MRKILGKLRSWFQFQREIYLDGKRYLDATPWCGRWSEVPLAHLESDIVRRYHVIEKGLSMQDFRPRFGKEMVTQLVALLREWDSRPDRQCGSPSQIAAARATLGCYRKKHDDLGVDVEDLLGSFTSGPCEIETIGGTKPYVPASPIAARGFEEVVRTRVSVRAFDMTNPPDPEKIAKAVELAIFSPSVCNRQTWRVHQFDGAAAQMILSKQSGNRGFGHAVPCALVITVDLRYFTGVSERYQGWIDGGMFAMLLLLGLHAEGLGAVALNWSVMNRTDAELRGVAGIPDHERVIMILACGNPADECVVPCSQRRQLNEILRPGSV